jgi:hypothetical protein
MVDGDRSLAGHEAGHAVIGRVLGMVCGGATIQCDDSSDGHAVTADPWAVMHSWEQRQKFRDSASAFRGRIIAFMAGREAEIECLGFCRGGDDDDRYQIALMMEGARIPGTDDDAEIRPDCGRKHVA